MDLLATGLLLAASPAGAVIFKTTRPGQYKELSLTVGSGFEYETDGEESEYGFPLFVEYGLTGNLDVTVEPVYTVVRKKDGESINAFGDLETALIYEFPTERRYRPAIALEGLVKWPTAPAGDLGTGKPDYSFGLIISKELPQCDLDLNAVYTVIGEPAGVRLKNTFEASFAAEWHLSYVLDIGFEVVAAFGAGGAFYAVPGSLDTFANIGGPEQGQTESEATLGFAEHLGDKFKLEEGMVLKSDGSWQLVTAWEFDFGEGR
jgi:hypothetical protein